MKKRAVLLAAVLGLTSLAGCGETPDTAIVKRKETESIEYTEVKNVSTESDTEEGEQDNPLRSRLGAPQQYTADFGSDDGKLKIHCDAKVEIPAVEQVSTYRVSQSDMTEEQMETFARVFSDGEIYDWASYPAEKRAPDFGSMFANLGEQLQSAVVERADGRKYDLFYKSTDPMPNMMELQMDAEGRDAISWNPRTSRSDRTEEEALSLAGITQEEALALAKEKVAELGIPGMEAALVQLGIHMDLLGDEYATDNAGWLINFTRTIDGIPITYTSDQGGAYEDMESEYETWGYEWLQMAVNGDGIQMAQCYNVYDIGEKTTENVQLINFDEVSQIFRQMMLTQNADMDSETREYQIDRITFGYTRIYDPNVDSRSGVLVPVWDFFGSYRVKAEYEGKTMEYISDSADMSHLTINAIDGSIIDRSLGY